MPGFYFIPNPLTWRAQQDLLLNIFRTCMGPPFASNLDDHYVLPSQRHDHLARMDDPGNGLWPYVLAEKGLLQGDPLPLIYKKSYNEDTSVDVYAENEPTDIPDTSSERPRMAKEVLEPYEGSAVSLLRKLRWVTLGQHYDWTTKQYIWGPSGRLPLPAFLSHLAEQICQCLPAWSSYKAEAGILNYYQIKDTLTGHVDRAEEDDQAPLFSLSLGSSAVFLVGGATRDDPVSPFLLNSGDIVIMSGPCRRFYHGKRITLSIDKCSLMCNTLGIPRILSDSCPHELIQPSHDPHPHWPLVMELIQQSRINVNIRQLYSSTS